jgi:Na+/proline symporter/anti-sigma regulatory factor (Ser/Thr protein kinase)
VVKLVAFLCVGVYVTWGLFDGFGDLFGRAAAHPGWSRLLTLDQPTTASYSRWTAMLVISMMAVMFLPRQFHVLVVQNAQERDVRTVSWSFPLYLLLINLFVLPIALAGLSVFPEAGAQADSFILRLPLHFDNRLMSIVVFLGGFSAATAMIVLDSLALSKMITNDVILPVLLRRRSMEDIYWITLFYTRLAMLGVVALGLMWARLDRGQFLLVEMGLLSFVAVSQCAPAILLGLYWRRGNRQGAFAGISAGFFMWFYTLIIPALGKEGVLTATFLVDGPFGLGILRPTAFLGLEGLDPLSHGVFWSLFLNTGLFVLVSLLSEQRADDRAQAAAFVGARAEDKGGAGAPAILSPTEIERLVHHFVGEEEARAITRELFGGKSPADLSVPELLELRIRFERLLAAPLGAAAARMIVEDRFTISKDEAQQLVASFHQMQESLKVSEEEVRRGERLLASVVQSVDDCIFTADVNGRLVTMNPAGQRLLGVGEHGLTGLGYADLLGPDDRRRAAPAIARAVEGGTGWSGQVAGGDRSGADLPRASRRPLHLRRARAAHGHGGGAPGSHRAGGDPAPAHSTREAGVAGRDGGGRRPRDPQPAGRDQDGHQPSFLGRAGRAAAVAGDGPRHSRRHRGDRGIINSLLDYTRDTRLERAEYEVLRILDPVVESAAATGRPRKIDVVYGTIERDLVAVGDGQKLRQVFANVLQNALEAIDPRGPGGRVVVDLRAAPDRVVVEVSDTGVGIGAEDREKIFLPFYTTKPSGTGLGMSIVKKIIDLHGGDIAVESAPGRGTRVRIALPAAAVHSIATGGDS